MLFRSALDVAVAAQMLLDGGAQRACAVAVDQIDGGLPVQHSVVDEGICLLNGLVHGQAQQAAFQEQSALQEPDELFRPDVGDPPYTIAVDAGHGGDDPGATGVVVERDMTAATAEALTRWLDADPNYIPAATRDSYDVTATPSERAERSNSQNPDLLLSIHGNSASTEAAGFECYPITPGRTWHRESVYFAHLLADGMEAAGASLRGQHGVRYIYYENGQKVLTEENDLRVRQEETFTLLEQSTCPAVLAEQCFVTSAADVELFGDADGCQLAARVYYQAICAYFGTTPLESLPQ